VRRPGALIGVLVVAVLVYIVLNTLRTEGPGSRGVPAGTELPRFAVPLALSELDGDANVARKAGQGAAGHRPACEVRGPEILNGCQLWERGPVVLAFLATRGARCTGELDTLERVRGGHPGVQFAAISIRGDRAALRALVRRHRWGFPVAYDRDGILANLYGVAVCPQVTYALPGGKVTGTTVGKLDRAGLDERIAALERAARAAEAAAPPRRRSVMLGHLEAIDAQRRRPL